MYMRTLRVALNVIENRNVIEDRDNGYVGRNEDEYVSAIDCVRQGGYLPLVENTY